MNKKYIIGFLILIVAVIGGAYIIANSSHSTGNVVNTKDRPVKEFAMDSFTVVKDGKYFPQYSLKVITVDKGDLVRLKITTTSGMHNINIDEFNVHSETPINETTVIEFVADKSGDFIYYCSKPGHRQNGHWGTLKVI